jgi:hypothetical protein
MIESWTMRVRRARLSGMNGRRLRILGIFLIGGYWAANISPAGAIAINPFAYCAKVGSIDASVDGASHLPATLIPSLRAVLGLTADAPLQLDGARWRCMDGAVYVCVAGANIPCYSKADLAARNRGAEHFCHRNHDAAVVPAYATGHASLYEWRCVAGKALRGKALGQIDRRGYRIDFWHRVPRD